MEKYYLTGPKIVLVAFSYNLLFQTLEDMPVDNLPVTIVAGDMF